MEFLRRLGWYLVGVSIGLVFLFFIINKKTDGKGVDFCYFPNCRVLKDLRAKPLSFDKELPQQYRDTIMVQSFLQDGDVDFKRSDTKTEPCKTYYVEKSRTTLKLRSCPEGLVVESVLDNKSQSDLVQ